MADCFSRWTEACPLPDKTAISVADAFFSNIVCRFGMPSVIHSDQGREFENKVMHELCLLGGSHKTKTTPYHPESDGLFERFNRTLLMMLAMLAGEHKDDWDDLLPPVMMAYRSSVHESTGFSPYRLMFGEECTLPMDIGLPSRQPDLAEDVTSPYAVWVKDSLEVAFDQVHRHSGQAVQRQKRLYDQRAVRRLFAIENWVMRYYPAGKKCKLDSIWTGPYLLVATLGWTVGIQRHPDEPMIFIHCQDVKKIPQPSGLQSWITIPPPGGTPAVPMLGASTVAHTSWDSPSVTALPPDEGVELVNVDSLRDGLSMSRHSESEHASMPSEGGRRASLTDSVVPEASPFAAMALRIDDTSALHPFFKYFTEYTRLNQTEMPKRRWTTTMNCQLYHDITILTTQYD